MSDLFHDPFRELARVAAGQITPAAAAARKLTQDGLALVRANAAAGCFMCRRVLEVLGPGRTMNDWLDGDGAVSFPVEAQKYHITGHRVADQAANRKENPHEHRHSEPRGRAGDRVPRDRDRQTRRSAVQPPQGVR